MPPSVYRSAGHALFHGGSPFTAFYTESHLPFTYPPFAAVVSVAVGA